MRVFATGYDVEGDDMFGPMLIQMAIEPRHDRDLPALRAALAELEADDPGCSTAIDAQSGQIILGGDSEERLDRAVDELRRVYGIALNVGAPQVAYRETLTRRVEKDYTYKTQAAGVGQFARVKIVFEPDTAGPAFVTMVRGGAVPDAFVPAVETGIAAVMRAGVLAGFPVVGVKATLTDGAYHETDSSAQAFETAARAAFREALREGGATLLEPVMRVEIATPEGYAGFVTGDVRGRRGTISGRQPQGDGTVLIHAMVPLANMFGYVHQLRSGTEGRATFTMAFSHYAPVEPSEPPKPFGGAAALRVA